MSRFRQDKTHRRIENNLSSISLSSGEITGVKSICREYLFVNRRQGRFRLNAGRFFQREYCALSDITNIQPSLEAIFPLKVISGSSRINFFTRLPGRYLICRR